MKRSQFSGFLATLLAVLLLLLGGCKAPELPKMPEMPDLSQLPELPGLPESLRDLPDVVKDLGLPDLSTISDLPSLEDLPNFQTPPGAISYSGPTEHSLNVGDRLPGTDIVLTAINDSGAEFQIAGMRSMRALGDSLDFDGTWPGIGGVDFSLRLRIYYVGSSTVRAAGVQSILIHDIQPVETNVSLSGNTIKLPFTVNASTGAQFPGMTLGYAGQEDRGANISGLPTGDYPFRKIGDSINWKGFVRADIPVEYNIRMLYYDTNRAQVGGIVTIALPSQ
ncbi:MAG: hypothetical protein R2867_16470 [Caldilineaceae bacterium]